jgi:hypothetical protein
VIEGTAEPVALPLPRRSEPTPAPKRPAGSTLTRRVAGGLIVFDDMATLPQGDGLAWPAFAGGLIGRELAFHIRPRCIVESDGYPKLQLSNYCCRVS